MVSTRSLINGQKNLIVDDEPDVLNDILEAKEKGKNFWWRWLDRLGPFYDRTFGADWKEKDEEFWKKLTYI